MRTRIALVLVVALASLTVVACGEKEEDTSATTSASLTKEQFVREANRICQQTDNKIESAAKRFFADAPAGEEAPPSEVAEFAQKTGFPAIEDEISRIRALGAPAGDEDQVKAMLDAAEEGLDKLKQDPDQIESGATAPALEKFDKLAGDYGLDKCAEA